MELDEFIKQTLIKVIKGVNEAEKDSSHNQKIYFGSSWSQGRNQGIGEFIDFDIALSAYESKEKDNKGGIAVAVSNIFAGASREKKEQESTENLHRIKFKVFVEKRSGN